MNSVVYDAAVLIDADKNQRRAWAEHKVRLELGIIPIVPAPVVAQVSRSSQQAQLRRFLTGCEVVALDEKGAHEAGRLMGIAKTSDVVDAAVVATALRRNATILTSDSRDIEQLLGTSARKVPVVAI
jgi:predicted nucleic acid-binding protein